MGLLSNCIIKLGKDKNVTAELLAKIYVAPECILDDICEVIVVEETA